MPRIADPMNFRGETLISKEELGLAPSSVLIDPDTGKLNQEFNPGIEIKFNNNTVEIGATKINFAGTVTTTDLGNGEVKVQIGDNMNSSSWNSTDGKNSDGTVTDISTSNGICPDASGATFKVGNWRAGQSIPATKNASVSFTSAGNVHFDDGDNVWTVTVFDADGTTELRKATITDNVSIDYGQAEGGSNKGLTFPGGTIQYSVGTNGITTSITGQAVEDNYPNAVGARAKRTFTFNLSQIVPNGGRVKIKIEGCGGSFTSKDFFFCNGVTPTIASATLAVNTASTKKISGVEYLSPGTTFTLTTGNLSNLNNQLLVSSNKVTFGSATGITAPTAVSATTFDGVMVGAANAYDNVSTYSNSNVAIAGNQNRTSVSINVTPVNYFATGTAKTATLSNILINTFATTASTDTTESFLNEGKRLITDSMPAEANFESNNTLVGTNELQVVPGVGLQYPKTNYSTYTTPAGNPNYSGMSGSKYFTRKFVKAGSLPGATLTFTTNASVADAVSAGNLKFLVSKDGTTWWNATFGGPGNQLGTSSSVFNSTSNKVVFTWSDGDANGFFYLKIEANENFAQQIKSITLA